MGGVNSGPAALIQVSATQANVNVAIDFDATGSFDIDAGDSLSYKWNFGDGTASSSFPFVSHSYSQKGVYTVLLIVTDKYGASSTAYETIQVGIPPTVAITGPTTGTKFAVGDVLTLVGSAVDSNGNALSALTWEVQLVHNDHVHPFLTPTQGNNIAMPPAPYPEGFLASTNSYLKIFLKATDSSGLSTTKTFDLQPKKVLLNFDSVPSGVALVIDDVSFITPVTVTAWEKQDFPVYAPEIGPIRYVLCHVNRTQLLCIF